MFHERMKMAWKSAECNLSAMAYGTDGPVAALGLQTLSDPKGVQPIYAPAPVVRESVLQA
ncbi:hypothetical protein ONJ87_27020, partial [Salmonella enterica subsp. enterica serovar Anatum]|nr:hypothetical protein [Salmonella enterica subsp. enterica serovar Anatum]